MVASSKLLCTTTELYFDEKNSTVKLLLREE